MIFWRLTCLDFITLKFAGLYYRMKRPTKGLYPRVAFRFPMMNNKENHNQSSVVEVKVKPI